MACFGYRFNMKSLTIALILTLFILLVVALFVVSNLLFEYVRINEKIKNENWSLIQACKKEERNPFNQRTFTPPKREKINIINKAPNWNYVR